MFMASDIPVWNDRTEAGLFSWWRQMAVAGMAFHPDDEPSTIVEAENEKRLFDDGACSKLRRIYTEMESLHGDRIYEAGQSALMDKMGWTWSAALEEWVPKSTAEQ